MNTVYVTLSCRLKNLLTSTKILFSQNNVINNCYATETYKTYKYDDFFLWFFVLFDDTLNGIIQKCKNSDRCFIALAFLRSLGSCVVVKNPENINALINTCELSIGFLLGICPGSRYCVYRIRPDCVCLHEHVLIPELFIVCQTLRYIFTCVMRIYFHGNIGLDRLLAVSVNDILIQQRHKIDCQWVLLVLKIR